MKNPSITKELRRELRQQSTKAEQILWKELRNRKCAGVKVKRQYGFGPYVLDFYVPELNIAIEVDGLIHEMPENKLHDINRDSHLKDNGIQVIRITNDEVQTNLDATLEKLSTIFGAKL